MVVYGQNDECTEQDVEAIALLGRVIVVEQKISNAWQDSGMRIEGSLEITDQRLENSFIDTYTFDASVGQVISVYLSFIDFYGDLDSTLKCNNRV